MPEAPEISQMRDGLRRRVCYQYLTIKDVSFHGRYAVTPPEGYAELRESLKNGVRLLGVDTKGKFMHWSLLHEDSGGIWYMFITHGMTGGWTFDDAPKHPVMKVTLSNGSILTLNDPRRFATVKIINNDPETAIKQKLDSLGPCILQSSGFAIPGMFERFRAKDHFNVCVALMDQSIVSGIGNYIKCEALWHASISPHRTIGSLNDCQLDTLILAAMAIADRSYNSGGATLATYSNVEGQQGHGQFNFNVYGKKLDYDGNRVVSEKTLDKRTTHWVPKRQK